MVRCPLVALLHISTVEICTADQGHTLAEILRHARVPATHSSQFFIDMSGLIRTTLWVEYL